jgi:hypothetical protein
MVVERGLIALPALFEAEVLAVAWPAMVAISVIRTSYLSAGELKKLPKWIRFRLHPESDYSAKNSSP